jgi:hypothetical protein
LKPGAYLPVCEPANVGDYVYHTEKQVIFIKEGTVTLNPKSTRLPVGTKLISVKTVKIWDDPGYENKRPRQITVRLLKDGKTVSTVVLSQANNWSHTWNDLLPNANWSVEEDVHKGYKSIVQENDNVFVITNQYKNIPQTGQVWWPVIAVLCLGLALIVIGLSARRSGKNEA